MENNVYGGCLAIQALFTALQPYEVFQWISLCITILSAIVGFIFKIMHWYRDANIDGKIDFNEIEKGKDIIDEGLKEIEQEIEKIK